MIHTFLDGEIKHGLLLAILNACDTGLITLLVIELHILDNGNGQVLDGRLDITQHKLSTVEQDFLDFFSIDSDISILINFGSRHTFNQLLNRGTLGRTNGFGVKDQRILSSDDLSRTSCDHCFFQQDTFRSEQQSSQLLILIATEGHLTFQHLITYRCDAQFIRTIRGSLNTKDTPDITHGTTDKRTVRCRKQLNGSLYHRFLKVCIQQLSANRESMFIFFLSHTDSKSRQ